MKSDIIFLSKNIKVFQWLSKSKFLSFITKMNPNNGNEKKQIFFYGTYSNLTPYLFLSKDIKVFQWLPKSKFLSFMTKMNPNNQDEARLDFFLWDIFKFDIVFDLK